MKSSIQAGKMVNFDMVGKELINTILYYIKINSLNIYKLD